MKYFSLKAPCTYKLPFIWIFYLLVLSSVSAQEDITTTEVLLGARKAELVQFDSTQLEVLKNFNYRLPLVRGVEFRSESRNFALRQQQYTLRVKPNSLRAVLANKKVYTSKMDELEIQGRINFNQELEDRYILLIEYLFNDKLMGAYQVKKIQLQDKLTILKQTVYDVDFDVDDIMKTEDDLFETQTILSNLQESQTYKNTLLQLMAGKDDRVRLNTDNVMSPDTIANTSIELLNQKENFEILLKESQLMTIESKMKLDVAESKTFIDFVQAEYRERDVLFLNENISIGFGINLPFFGNARKIKSDHYLDKVKTESEITALKNEQETQENLAVSKFRSTVTLYKAYKERASTSSNAALLKFYPEMEGVSPLILIKLKISENNKNIEMIELERVLYETYIEMLAVKNVLFQTPFNNYLVDNNVLIEN